MKKPIMHSRQGGTYFHQYAEHHWWDASVYGSLQDLSHQAVVVWHTIDHHEMLVLTLDPKEIRSLRKVVDHLLATEVGYDNEASIGLHAVCNGLLKEIQGKAQTDTLEELPEP